MQPMTHLLSYGILLTALQQVASLGWQSHWKTTIGRKP